MNSTGGGGLALICAILTGIFGYKAVEGYLASSAPWGSAGFAVLAIAVLLLLWWLFGESSPTGLQLARKTVGKLTEEEASRNRTLSLAGILFAAAAILLVAMLMAGVL